VIDIILAFITVSCIQPTMFGFYLNFVATNTNPPPTDSDTKVLTLIQSL
jgi:hypothetical protein